jgi:hypothetical protein
METTLDCKPIGYLSVSGAGNNPQKDPQIELVTEVERFAQILSNIFYISKVHVPQVDFSKYKVVVIIDRDLTNNVSAVMLSSFSVKDDSLELTCHVLPSRQNQGFLFFNHHHISLLAVRIPKNIEHWSVNFQKMNQWGSYNWGVIERPTDLEILQAKEQSSLINMKSGYDKLYQEMPEAINQELYNKRIVELTQAIDVREKTIKALWRDSYLQKLGPDLLQPLE